MSLITPVNIPISKINMDHTQSIMSLGSCFANNMGHLLAEHFFSVQQNPFGIIYHPLVILNSIQRIINGPLFSLDDLEKNAELYHSWAHHGAYSAPESDQALEKINKDLIKAKERFQNLDWLILTFGTAYGYQLKSHNRLVANCHKYPADHFEKILSPSDRMQGAYIELFKKLKAQNPKLKILLTVSPIRHKKEGLIENNRSKARLLLLAECLESTFSFCNYFPAYELLLDELRDYRYYDRDMVHASGVAQEYIWAKFSQFSFNPITQAINNQLQKFQQAANHRPFYPQSQAHQKFLADQSKKLAAFADKYQFLNLDRLKEKFNA